MYKCVNEMVPPYLSDNFTLQKDVLDYELRRCQYDVLVPFPTKEFYKRSFVYSGATLWNSLPANIRRQDDINSFKAVLRKHQF